MFGVGRRATILVLRLLRTLAGSASLLVLRGPAITVTLVATLCLSTLMVRESSLQPPLQVPPDKPHRSDEMQRELRAAAQRDEVMDRLMQAVLAKVPTAARVRFVIIHAGDIGLTRVGLLRFDIVRPNVNQEYSVGPFVTKDPISDWTPYPSRLLADECSAATLDGMLSAEQNRMIELAASKRLVCPVVDIQGRLVGGLFIAWSAGAVLPDAVDRHALGEFTQLIAARIAAAITPADNDMARF